MIIIRKNAIISDENTEQEFISLYALLEFSILVHKISISDIIEMVKDIEEKNK